MTFPIPPGYVDPHSYSPLAPLQKTADTGINGFALQNATPTILSWTVPNDGQLHMAIVCAIIVITSTQTGGVVTVNYTAPSGSVLTHTIFSGGLTGPGDALPNQPFTLVCRGNSVVTVTQSSNQSAGAASVFAQIWGA